MIRVLRIMKTVHSWKWTGTIISGTSVRGQPFVDISLRVVLWYKKSILCWNLLFDVNKKCFGTNGPPCTSLALIFSD